MKALIAIGMVGLAALTVPAGHAQTVFLSKYNVDTSPDRYKDRFVNRRPATYGPLLEGGDPAEKK